MGASLIVSIFLAFSLSLSWFSGDKENGFLEDTIQETMAKQEAINNQYRLLTVKMREKDDHQKVLESKLKRELKKQKKLKRNLAMEKRKMRIAVESGKAVDVEAERERIRKEVEKRASKEIAKLEERIATVEKEKKRIAENARRGLMATRDKDSEAWSQAEAAKARAQDAVLKYKALKSELENLRASREQADSVLREQAMARKKADEALARIKAERASLKARLRAAERTLTLTSAPATEKRVNANNDAAPLVTEIEKARDILRRKIKMRNRTITELERKAKEFEHNAKLTKDNEKESLRSALENKARRVAELEKALVQSRTREQALRANLKGGTTTAKAAGDPVERARIESLRARVQSLQAKLRETENNKKAFAEKARARIEALRKRTQELDTRNMKMEKDLKDGTPQRARALPSVKSPQLPKDKRELQAKLSGDGLVDLRSKASNYVAQKMVDRNVELEAKLEETRLQLAEAESAFRNARYPASMELRPGSGDTNAIIARYRKASTTITILNKRNVALEAKADETARALAQAEASRFIIEQLHSQNLELKKKLRAMDEAKKATQAALAFTAGHIPVEASVVPIGNSEKAQSPVNLAQAPAASIEAPAVAMSASVLPDVAAMAPVAVSAEAQAVNSDKHETMPAVPDVKTAPAAVLGIPVAANIENPVAPVMVARLEKGLDLESAMHSIIPVAKAAKPVITAVKSPAQLKAARRASAKELRDIVNKIQDLNASLALLNKGHGSESPSLVEIHEGLRKLKKRIILDLDKGLLSMKDIVPYTGVDGAFTFYVIKKGETPEEIAGRKDLYGDSSMWPLLYRYNQTRFDQPDISSSGRLLIIYKNLSAGEKEEAMKKAQALGQWAKWKDEDKRAWIEDWIM